MKTKPKIYTQEFVRKEVKKLLAELKNNPNIIYSGELIAPKNYSVQRFSEWDNEFKNDKQISETIKKIREILETRVNVGGLRNKLNASIVKFNLINNYNWKEKAEIEHQGDGLTIKIVNFGENDFLNPDNKDKYERNNDSLQLDTRETPTPDTQEPSEVQDISLAPQGEENNIASKSVD